MDTERLERQTAQLREGTVPIPSATSHAKGGMDGVANGENLDNAKNSQIEQLLQTPGNIVTLTKSPVAVCTHNKHEPAALQVGSILAVQNGKGKTKCQFPLKSSCMSRLIFFLQYVSSHLFPAFLTSFYNLRTQATSCTGQGPRQHRVRQSRLQQRESATTQRYPQPPPPPLPLQMIPKTMLRNLGHLPIHRMVEMTFLERF